MLSFASSPFSIAISSRLIKSEILFIAKDKVAEIAANPMPLTRAFRPVDSKDLAPDLKVCPIEPVIALRLASDVFLYCSTACVASSVLFTAACADSESFWKISSLFAELPASTAL